LAVKVLDQKIGSNYALYNGDSVDIMQGFPDNSMHLSIYSPPFGTKRPGGAGLYVYSSSERDLSNCHDYKTFMQHYEFFVEQIQRITLPGRFSCVHAAEVPTGNSGGDSLTDFPGDIIRLHESHEFRYKGRHVIWKEPLWVRNRTLTKDLAHRTVVDDSLNAGIAGADYLLLFQKAGKSDVPVKNPTGLLHYAGETKMPADRLRYRGWTGDQKQNLYSHWIWRQYASSIWDDIRMGNVLPFEEGKDEDDEQHVHPLQKDVVERCCVLRSNPGENVWTPFAGVGTEVCGALATGRRGIGGELKPSYFKQMVKNVELNPWYEESEQQSLFAEEEAEMQDEISA
jgi:DNA modification methylase